tara:strand:+ start:578 stop:1663 length:1086 start_codon:yes stop_codon:yes gene_type:complete
MGDALRMAVEEGGPPITPSVSMEAMAALADAPPAPGRISNLTIANPAKGDGEVTFREAEHEYWHLVGGVSTKIRKSTTGMLKPYFETFDGEAVVNEHFASWKGNKNHKYGQLIGYLRVVKGLNDDEIKREILAYWDQAGNEAAAIGTRVHEECQCLVESWPPPREPMSRAAAMFRDWLLGTDVPVLMGTPSATGFLERNQLKPWRAEWILAYTLPETGVAVVAGQVDLVLRSTDPAMAGTEHEYWCIDYKTTNPAPKYLKGPPNLLGNEDTTSRFAQRAKHPFSEYAATDFGKYTAQLNVYGHMAATQYGVDFRSHMYVLQINDDARYLPTPNFRKVPRMDVAVAALFAAETAATIDEHSP